MAQESFEFEGKTVEEAIDAALENLNLGREQIEVEVLSSGSRGILGFGSEPAKVRVTPQPDVAEEALAAEAPTEGQLSDAVTQLGVSTEAVEGPPAPQQLFDEKTVSAADDVLLEEETADQVGASTANAVDLAIPETPEDDEALVDLAVGLLARLVELMGFEAELVASWHDPDEEGSSRYLRLDILGDNLGALIGRRGETLANLQYLLRLMVNQQLKQWKNIVVDVEHYKQRRVVQLNQLAERTATQVVETGRSVPLEPMPPNERRIVHLALRHHPGVYTESFGEGEHRKVEILPKQ
jgi:spoIIIJ-associated protein